MTRLLSCIEHCFEMGWADGGWGGERCATDDRKLNMLSGCKMHVLPIRRAEALAFNVGACYFACGSIETVCSPKMSGLILAGF